ncbi:MBL fold metallo-hydrolase [Bacillus aerolatus]|uniref:MBL fold metallo-hydrolase n=1 Tax=Bacillus aerolatus TaxID=2653354 RepID=A0A6I1FKF7_9BACI|nr:MBL fold metallo-hydrolase [Bacillus aerolatus]KAB7709165.1 MBL fold metallo-hydrolase [Bacillus aerolatus]
MLEQLGIKLIRVDLPFRLNHVNCFLAEGEHGWTIIDTGLNNESTRGVWNEYIEDKEITDLLVTHYHPDHFGYAGGLQKLTGARVSMSRIDAEAGMKAWTNKFIEHIRSHYETAGIPAEIADQMTRNTAEFKPLVTPSPEIDHYFGEGEKISIGRYEYEVIFTPGHSDGMVCFYNEEKSVLFSADHILPKITPNISYWFHGNENPLKSYLFSLKNMKRLDADLVIPSHGKPFHGANKRIDELLQHHEDRLTETIEAIKEGSTVYEVCGRLFRPGLTVHELRFAVGETLAHLEYLRYAGECRRETRNGQWFYIK